MAEQDRKVVWRALLDIVNVKKGAKEAEKSLDDLEKKEKSLGKTFEDTEKRINASSAKMGQSQNGLSSALSRVSQAYGNSQRNTEKYLKSLQALTKAHNDHNAASAKAEVANLRLSTSVERLAAAEERVYTSGKRVAETQSKLANAQANYDKALKSTTTTAADVEIFLNRLETAQKNYTSAQQASLNANSSSAKAHEDNAKAANANAKANDNLSVALARVRERTVAVQSASTSRFGRDQSRTLDTLRNGYKGLEAAAGSFVDLLLIKLPAISGLLAGVGSAVSALAGGLVALGSALGPIVGLLGVIPGGFAALAVAGGGIIAAFSGVMKTMKAYTQQQAQAGAQAKTLAAQQKSAAAAVVSAKKQEENAIKAIATAQKGVVTANKNVVSAQRGVVTANKRVADAVKGVATAYKRVAAASRNLKDAQQGVRDSYANASEQAARSVEQIANAEKNVADAQKNSRLAQADLNRARGEAIRQLDQMRRSARDAAFAEEEATLSLADAKDALARVKTDPNATQTEVAQADLNYREAQARLEDARKNKVQAIADNAEAQRKGVEGSDVVVNAQQKIVDTSQAVLTAQKDLINVQKDAAKAQKNSADAIVKAIQSQTDAQDNLKDAQDGVKDAQDGVKEAHLGVVDAADRVKEAQQGVVDAQTRVTDAQNNATDAHKKVTEAQQGLKDALNGTTKGTDAYNAALAKLSPAGRAFVKYLISLKDKLDSLKRTAETGLLPGVETGLKSLMTLFPLVEKTVGNTTKIMGDSFAALGARLAKPDMRDAISRIFGSNEKVVGSLSRAVNSLVVYMVKVADAARPLTEYIASSFAAWARGRESIPTSQMADFFAKTKHVLVVLSSIFGNVYKGLKNVGRAGENFGNEILANLDKMLKKWADWTATVEGQNALRQWFDDVKPAFYEITGLIGDLAGGLTSLGASDKLAPFVANLRDTVIPNIKQFFKILGDGGGAEAFSKFLTTVSEGLVKMADSGALGGLSRALDFLTQIFQIGMNIFNVPGIGPAIGGIATALTLFKALKFTGQITGLTNLAKGIAAIFKLGKTRRGRAKEINDEIAAVASASGQTPEQVAAAYGTAGGKGSKTKTKPKPAGAHRTPRRTVVADNLRGAGVYAVTGFASGIEQSTKSVVSAGTKMANALMGAIKRVLKIRSPSLAMRVIGENASAGYVLGITDGIDDAGLAGRGLGAAAKEGATVGSRGTRQVGEAASGATGGSVVPGAPERGKPAGRAAKIGGGLGAAAGVAALATSFIPLDGILGTILPLILTIASMAIPALVTALGAALAPVLAVVGVFAALAGMFVLLFNKNKFFHDYVINAWENIKNFVSSAWNDYIYPALEAFGKFITDTLVPAISDLWNNTIKPVFKAIGDFISNTWTSYIQPAFKAIWSFITDTLVPAIEGLWNNVIKPVFTAIGNFIAAAWNNVIKPVFKAIWGFISELLAPLFMWLLHKVIEVVWKAISAAISFSWGIIKSVFSAINTFITNTLGPIFTWLWTNVIKPVWGWITDAIGKSWTAISGVFKAIWGYLHDTLGPIFSWLWDKVVRPVWGWISGAISGAWTAISPIFTKLKNGVDAVGKMFTSVKDGIVQAWSDLSSALDVPVQATLKWVQESMINPVNKFLSDIGIKWQLGSIYTPDNVGTGMVHAGHAYREKHASGGRVGGSSPHNRADNIPAMLTAGEYVLPVTAVQKISSSMGPNYLENLRQGKPNRYADGGFVRPVNGKPGFPWGHYPSGRVHRALDIPVGVGTPVVAAENGSIIRAGWDKTGFGNHIRLAYENGTYMILGHLSSIVAKEGQRVRAGQLVGYSGNTGNSTGPHVHVEMRRSPYDPSTAYDFSKSWYNGNVPPEMQSVKQDTLFSTLALGAYDFFTNPIRTLAGATLPKFGMPGQFMYGAGMKILDGVRSKIADWTMDTTQVSTYAPGAPTDSISSSVEKQNRTGEFVRAYAKGGKVPGAGNGDTVPAMLTPGEYVLRKSAVRALGISNLNRLNGTSSNSGNIRDGVGYYNSGGPVVSPSGSTLKQGGNYRFMNLIHMLQGRGGWHTLAGNSLQNWSATDSAILRRNKGIIPNGGKTFWPTWSPAFAKSIASYLNGGTATRQRSLWQAASHFNMLPMAMAYGANKYRADIRKTLDGKKATSFWSQRSQIMSSGQSLITNASSLLGRRDTYWNPAFQTALQHMMYHGMSPQFPHSDNLPTPWPLTAVQQGVQQQNAANALQTEYNGYLDKFSQWGLPYLVDKLQELGPQDGINIARASAKDRTSATKYDASLKTSKQLTASSTPESYKFVAYLNSSKQPGIRSAAREMGVPDYEVVQMWDKMVSAKRLNPALPNFAKMMKDIGLYRKGLFYAATGGQVPGTGSGDTVPAMLTPGEYVLRKSAVRALGIDNVRALNNTQYFANGGPVFNPQVPSFGGVSRSGMGSLASRIMAQGTAMTTVNINTTINNPVAERSSQSFNQMLRRQTAMKTFGANAQIGTEVQR